MADMKRIKGRIQEVIRPNGVGAITAAEHQSLLLEIVDDINTKKADLAELDELVSRDDLATINGKRLDKGGNITIEGGAGNFDAEGKYPNLVAGDLYGHGESVPAEFSFRATGGKSIKDGVAYIKELQGNAVVWNQQVTQTAKIAEKEGDYYPIFTYATTAQEHTYLIEFDDVNRLANQWLIIGADANGNYKYIAPNMSEGKRKSLIFTMSPEDGNVYVRAISSQNPAELPIENIRFHDLTLMFNAGNEPTSLEEYYARKPIVADEYAFNEGEVIAFKGDAIKSVGDNALKIDGRTERVVDEGWEPHIPKQFDENIWYNGVSANGYGGTWSQGSFAIKDGKVTGVADRTAYGVGFAVRLLPNEEYYISAKNTQGDIVIGVYDKEGVWFQGTQYASGEKFTTPSNAAWGLVVVRSLDESNLNVDVSDIMLTLVHSGWKVDTNAGYQPYWEDTLQIDSRIREAFPNGMHKWDKVYNKDGKGYIVKGTGVVEDMGALDWGEGFGGFITTVLRNLMRMPHTYEEDTILCSAMTTNGGGKSIGVVYAGEDYPYNGTLKVLGYESRDDFLADIQGIPLYYELAEPTIEPFETPFKLDYKVADFGTEELIAAQPSAPFRARTIYQFNAVDQIRENYNEIERIKAALAKAGITLD